MSEKRAASLTEILQLLNPDCSYDEWIRVGMVLCNASVGSLLGLKLWNEWSAKGRKYIGIADLESRWQTFVHAGRYATVRAFS